MSVAGVPAKKRFQMPGLGAPDSRSDEREAQGKVVGRKSEEECWGGPLTSRTSSNGGSEGEIHENDNRE